MNAQKKKGKEGVIRIRSKSLRGARLANIILGRFTAVWLGRVRKTEKGSTDKRKSPFFGKMCWGERFKGQMNQNFDLFYFNSILVKCV